MAKFVKAHHDNPYPDYPSASSNSKDDHFDQRGKIAASFERHWAEILGKIPRLDYKSYSIYTGTSGLALLMLLKDPQSAQNLHDIKDLLQLNRLRGNTCSFLCGDAGPLAIGAVVSYKLGELDSCRSLCKKLLSMHDSVVNEKSEVPDELLYGRAGYLFSLLYLNKHIASTPVEDGFIRETVAAILNSGSQQAKIGGHRCPLMFKFHSRTYLGAAHGISGIMCVLLQAREHLTKDELENLVRPTIEYVARQKFPGGNFPACLESDVDDRVQWCHGAPGVLYMFTNAYKALGDARYLEMALQCGEVTWQRGILKKGYSICHGVAGNAYCFLELYQVTRDPKHLHRGMMFAEWCADFEKRFEGYTPDRPLSLFEGVFGRTYLLLDVQNPLEARFPGYAL